MCVNVSLYELVPVFGDLVYAQEDTLNFERNETFTLTRTGCIAFRGTHCPEKRTIQEISGGKTGFGNTVGLGCRQDKLAFTSWIFVEYG